MKFGISSKLVRRRWLAICRSKKQEVYRKWDRQDERSYQLIRSAIRSEFDIFRTGQRYYD
jgi:hypothetical protein